MRKLASIPVRARQLQLEAMGVNKGTQLLLGQSWRESFRVEQRARPFEDVEFRSYSQNGEDGILHYIFSLIGAGSRRCVEICAGSGIQCNSTNLIINHGWNGLLFDGNSQLIAKGRRFFSIHPDTSAFPPQLVNAWITSDNINELISAAGVQGEVDLLSLDMDGIDWWVWDRIDVIRPRVVVAEVQIILGPDASLTVPNDPSFRAEFADGCGIYCGASIAAFVKLARRKGYRLVGCQRYGFNAFFLRDDVGAEIFPEVPAANCFRHPFAQWAQDRFYPRVKDRPWVEV
ncbi:hypothetical protein [Piscinibacter sakaiensis]|uniref:hypothetical protein n=1 Tax=Piscinibacter sakaiensis TaxID=1547922 RepID=UPI003AAF133D